MTNSELNQILQAARLPQPPDEYWQRFPQRTLEQIRLQKASSRVSPPGRLPCLCRSAPQLILDENHVLVRRIAIFTALAGAVCVLLGVSFLFWNRRAENDSEPQLVTARMYYQEIASLFPNQVRGIAFDQSGAHLDLAETPTVPASTPIYVKICRPTGCQHFITFSGQKIRVRGEVCDVLIDRRGAVLVVGQSLVWSSSESAGPKKPYRIEARALGVTS